MMKKRSKKLVISPSIENVIYIIRGQRVMLDEDLAKIYGTETKVLNQAIRRNEERFPGDFMFQLTVEEFANLRSQFVTSSYGGRRYMPFAFTEHGAVMLASVLKSKRAVQMSIEVVKAFVRLHQAIVSRKDMVKHLDEVRSFMLKQSNKTDREFRKVWRAIEDLTNPPDKNLSQPIGFRID
ncbi:MAG: ORF6N domain-containing protein [Patescibacteria group bacterium]